VIYGARINEAILAGELWRFLTPALLHGSLPHIAFNMYALLSFGTSLERHFGHGRFFLLYVLGAFTGNVASFLFSPYLVVHLIWSAHEAVFPWNRRSLAFRAIGKYHLSAAITVYHRFAARHR
jgi:membrane associated rhomboid family serine protease